MHHADYVPLHVHTEYSLLDGSIKIDELVEVAGRYKMPALAITDHGNLFGAVEFYKKVTKAGMKPIIGCETYVAPVNRFEKGGSASEASYHLILLAKDIAGYRNLVNLVSRAYTEGFYYKPRIDKDLLAQYSGGLIGLSSCLKGEVPYFLGKDMVEKARESALEYRSILGPDNFFIEVQANGLEAQERVNRKLVELAKDLHLGVVATNDCHYLKKEDARAHDVLLCIQTGKTMSDRERMHFETNEFYFKSPEEMKRAFREIPEAVMSTRQIAERCNMEFDLTASLLPTYHVESGMSADAFLRELASKGLKEKFGQAPPDVYRNRLKTELDIITKMKYASYFLIVWDFISYARRNGIPVGPGRGSAAGSLVANCLGITEIDPIRYNLLFERFLNPERISMPDIDVDFCKDRRGEVISYVSGKYGTDHVAQIITFGTMAAKAAIRDVGRSLDVPYAEVDRIAKLVPATLNITLEEALRVEPQLKALYDGDPKVKEIVDIAKRLEGLCRHASTHAAGVVVSPKPLTEYAPLYKNPTDGTVTTQFDMSSVESIGLLKFDFLGLKTLTVIEKTLEYIRGSGGDLSLESISLDDAETYRLLGSGQTTGIFQLESAGMRDILTRLQPNRFEDLIALVALYRPGPMAWIDDFIKRKKGEARVSYDLPHLKEILDETYGIFLYQEQVMMIANRVAGFTMGQADILRRAMGKKKPEEMERQKEVFIRGAVANGVAEKKARKVFENMEPFAMYGFNKSHSAAYAYIAYQTAYLKAHYPVEFMAATLSADMDSTDKIVKSIAECRNMGIDILPPDINESDREFKVIGKAIRFGLEAVKGVGSSAIEAVLDARGSGGTFRSLEDFLQRVDGKKVNKKVIESLVKAGAFDSFGVHRARALTMLIASLCGDGMSAGLFCQQDIFGAAKQDEIEEWDEMELLKHEKDSIGFYITSHPLSKYREALTAARIRRSSDLDDIPDKAEVQVAGVISAVKKIKTRGKAETMAYITVEDEEGSVEAIIFPELYKSSMDILAKDSLTVVKGAVDRAEKGVKVIAKEMEKIGDVIARQQGAQKVEITLRSGENRPEDLRRLKDMLSQSAGSCPLYLRIVSPDSSALIVTSHRIEATPQFVGRLEALVGQGMVKVL